MVFTKDTTFLNLVGEREQKIMVTTIKHVFVDERKRTFIKIL